ncbi:hypothetical protein MPDQ_002743 [Monascus purpureus]|uniref:Xylanolytic transcriptional activator regulatory domain-containing protein n=1 Tax=Monascus purpureus TaxID=5098 RepID=A0A507R2X6_MONPU|nr:hypothetical protein MPDQ_002743 [Monascus purpureus]
MERMFQSLERSVAEIARALYRSPGNPSPPSDHGLPGQRDAGHENFSYWDVEHDMCSHSPVNGLLFQPSPFALDPSLPLDSLHPPSAMIPFMWQTYLETVDPVLKIFHAPTVQKQIMSRSRGRRVHDSSVQCLMLAVYYSTVVTMSAAACLAEFEEERPALLKRHDEHGPDAGSLIGMATGIAMRIGLHRDGAALNLPPFQVEMRRRLWWQIYALDVRIAEDRKSDPCILDSSLDAKFPSNVNDAGLHPDMGDPPKPNPGRTEMLFSLIRFEMSRFARQLIFSTDFCRKNFYPVLSPAQQDDAIEQFSERIEEQYLMYCDTTVPFDFVTAASSRLALKKLKNEVCRPGVDQSWNLPIRIQPDYMKSSVEILQRSYELRHHQKGKIWLWFFQPSVEWDALAYLLLGLCMPPPRDGVDSAWEVANATYHDWKNDAHMRRDSRWGRIEFLHSRAEAMQDKLPIPQTASPDYRSSRTSADYIAISVPSKHTGSLALAPGSTGIGLGQCPSPNVGSRHDSIETERSNDTWTPANMAATVATDLHDQASEMTTGAPDMPSTGTACEWSAQLLRQYFDVVDHKPPEYGLPG